MPRFQSKVTKEKCVFCETPVLQQNMKRHLTEICDVARFECRDKDILKEAEKRKAKRKGYGDVKTMFQTKPKSARVGNVSTETERRGEEELLIDDAHDEEMETDELNNQPNETGELETDTNIAHLDAPNININPILEKLESMSIGIGEGFKSVYERLDVLEQERRKVLPPMAKPKDLEPEAEDDRLFDLRKCVNIDDILELMEELEVEYEDGLPFIYCSVCCPQNSIFDVKQNGVFQLTGPASEENGKMTKAFSNLKISIKKHVINSTHTKQLGIWREKEQRTEREKSKNEAAAMRVARIAYTGFQKGRSKKDFEEEVLLGKC